ncbi:MAG: HNH endonuclease, partial [Clostridia bacterium]|nr:HNH endonuclease [Clostridia bacterium]
TEKDISVKSVISEDYKTEWGEETEDEGRVRFESIINFPYFLLHTLRVFAHINDFAVGDFTSGLLDDKKLTETFDNFVKEYGAEKFSSEFIAFLLKSRYLFDKYIIKREFKNDNDDGDWSLKELFSYGQGGQKKPQYNNTRFVIGKGKDGKNEHQENLMIQSCMRVSYTSPKIMHWITELLKYLFKEQSDLSGSNVFIERIAETAVWENYLYKGNESLGVATPHIVFNFLDYLLWKENKNKYQDFIFEFRNSVEHWYPQHPSEGSFPEWSEEAELNHFGNLCIVSRDINSKFSNLAPEAKKSTYKESVLKGSIKLRIMSALTDNSEKWKNETFSEHGLEMLNLLKKYCRPETV